MSIAILGLGSSIGDKLNNFRRALKTIKQIKNLKVQAVSPIYRSDALMPKDAPAEWNVAYFNLAIKCEIDLSPHELLKELKLAEIKVGRLPAKKWGPRIIDIDILCIDNLVLSDSKLQIPHEGLPERPFALWPLADLAPFWRYPIKDQYYNLPASAIAKPWGSRFTGNAPFHTRQISQRIDTPQLMAILNLTTDSFSRDGQLQQVDSLVKQAKDALKYGANILDIGAEATNPNAAPITADIEWQRLENILPEIIAIKNNYETPVKISLDTRHPETAKRALDLGIDWINDVSGLENPEMQKIAIKYNCKIVIMHSLTIPANKDKTLALDIDPINEILIWSKLKIVNAIKAGIKQENIIIDPGIGFGKNSAQSIEILKRVEELKVIGLPILIGHSRKSFMQEITPEQAQDRDIETIAISQQLSSMSIDFLRVHNIAMHTRFWRAYNHINNKASI